MNKALLLLSSALLMSGFGQTAAADDIPTVSIEQYRVGAAPAGIAGPERPAAAATESKASTKEKAAALNGTFYSVIAPTYTGATQSFVRLFNGAQQASTFSVTVVGSPTGRTYGTANISVPRSASPQYSLTQILTNASAGALNGGDTSYALYVQNPDTASGWQHVTFNGNNNFFENASVCKTLLNQQVASISSTAVLTNVHTSRLAAFPSEVQIHNFWNAAVTYRVTAIDSTTGTVLGAVNVNTQANASYVIPESQLESQLNFTPSASQTHINLFVTDPTGAPPYEVLGQTITNTALSAQINMTTACAVNALSSMQSSDPGGGGGGLNGY